MMSKVPCTNLNIMILVLDNYFCFVLISGYQIRVHTNFTSKGNEGNSDSFLTCMNVV